MTTGVHSGTDPIVHFFAHFFVWYKKMTQIIHINKVQTMTSLEIAELTGKQQRT